MRVMASFKMRWNHFDFIVDRFSKKRPILSNINFFQGGNGKYYKRKASGDRGRRDGGWILNLIRFIKSLSGQEVHPMGYRFTQILE